MLILLYKIYILGNSCLHYLAYDCKHDNCGFNSQVADWIIFISLYEYPPSICMMNMDSYGVLVKIFIHYAGVFIYILK